MSTSNPTTSRHVRRAASALLALAALLGPSSAHAQDGEGTDGSQILFQEGVEHLRAERYAQAVEAFRGSYRLVPRVTTMCNLALTYDRWGPAHHEAAIRAYRTCAAEDESGRFRPHARERITALERELALEGDAPTEGTAPPDEPPPDARSEEAPEPPPTTAPYGHELLYGSLGVAGGGALALVVGAILAVDAQDRRDALEAEAPEGRVVRGSPAHERLDAARATADGATAMYVVAAVLGAAAAGLLAVDLVLASNESSDVALRFSPTGFSGRF
ncbi:MAG TPA: hypothetical protein RMH99_22205 [Sandaracinaceae bacterium LLY-WYZ-13_1]|nr:hypothetical protein [Sandaracinaceae bacterium LLY-WYZ-13_1]